MPIPTKASTQLVIVASLILVACSRIEEPKTFEDCILVNASTGKSPDAIALLKVACKGKFPKVFDFDVIASTAPVSRWREVAVKDEFSSLPEAGKSEARLQYFNSVVLPRIDPTYLEDARTQFDSFSRQTERATSPSSPAASAAAK